MVMHSVNWVALEGLWNLRSGRNSLRISRQRPEVSLWIGNLQSTIAPAAVHLSWLVSDKILDGGETAAGDNDSIHQSDSTGYILCQLGGYGAAYSIAEYVPAKGWQGLARTGTVRNLVSQRSYSLECLRRGQEIRLIADGVRVLQHSLSQPLSGNQVGLYCWGPETIRFRDFSLQSEQPRAFIAMQFGEPFDTIYREVIKPKALEHGLDVVRIDEVSGPGIIFEDIKRAIAESSVIIAEITAPNQNVFYELGYAHALNKPTILLAQRGKELPFDIRSYRVIFYDDTIGGKPHSNRGKSTRNIFSRQVLQES